MIFASLSSIFYIFFTQLFWTLDVKQVSHMNTVTYQMSLIYTIYSTALDERKRPSPDASVFGLDEALVLNQICQTGYWKIKTKRDEKNFAFINTFYRYMLSVLARREVDAEYSISTLG